MLGGGITSALRYLWMFLTRGPHFGSDLLRATNRRFCNGPDKVIGWSRGYPSYYLLSPPLFSPPAMNSLTTRIMSVYQWRNLPDLASVAVTDTCNAACEFCSFARVKRPGARLLSTEELKGAIRQAQQLGVSTVNIVGGEPLMRPDLVEIIGSIDKDMSQVVLFTNGFRLREHARELKRAGLTSVLVALDSADPAEHDRRKGQEGSFAAAIDGILAARKAKLLVGISTVVRPNDIESGALVRLFELGKKLRVNQIFLFDALNVGHQKRERGLAWGSDALDMLIELAASYHRRKDYPGIHTYAYSKSHRAIGCAGGVSHFYISPYGDLAPCDFDPTSVGNLRERPLHALWDEFARTGLTHTALDGCRCARAESASPDPVAIRLARSAGEAS